MTAMANVEKISIALPSEMLETIREAVDAGEYASTSEVIRDALRRWETNHLMDLAIKRHGLKNIRAKVRKGIESLDRGEGIPAEEVYAESIARREGKRKKKGAACRK